MVTWQVLLLRDAVDSFSQKKKKIQSAVWTDFSYGTNHKEKEILKEKKNRSDWEKLKVS